MAARNSNETAKSIASALAFASYIISNLAESELNEIKQILWLERAEHIFIEISKNPEFKKRILAIAKQYLHAVDFDIGQLEKTPSGAITLYSRFCGKKTVSAKTIISWDVVKPESARVLLNKRLFGYVHHGVSYSGLMEKYSGEKLGKGCIAVPSQYAEIFLILFRGMKISALKKEVTEVV